MLYNKPVIISFIEREMLLMLNWSADFKSTKNVHSILLESDHVAKTGRKHEFKLYVESLRFCSSLRTWPQRFIPVEHHYKNNKIKIVIAKWIVRYVLYLPGYVYLNTVALLTLHPTIE